MSETIKEEIYNRCTPFNVEVQMPTSIINLNKSREKFFQERLQRRVNAVNMYGQKDVEVRNCSKSKANNRQNAVQ